MSHVEGSVAIATTPLLFSTPASTEHVIDKGKRERKKEKDECTKSHPQQAILSLSLPPLSYCTWLPREVSWVPRAGIDIQATADVNKKRGEQNTSDNNE